MSWQNLLSSASASPGGEIVTYPWSGGRELLVGGRRYLLKGKLPSEEGWHEFSVQTAREVRWKGPSTATGATYFEGQWRGASGYLVGDRLIPDNASVNLAPESLPNQGVQVHLLDPGLPRFCYIHAGRWEDNRLIFIGQSFSPGAIGVEDLVEGRYFDRAASVTDVPGVTPPLDLAFRVETWRRAQVEEARRILEAERVRREAEEAAAARREQVRAQVEQAIGNGALRRELAAVDFEAAARAALRVSGAKLLDTRKGYVKGEMIVQYEVDDHGYPRRLECVCDARTMRVISAGFCLTDHHTGQKGDTFFTLESLPLVAVEAIRKGKLVVWRYVEGDAGGRGQYFGEDYDGDED